MPSIKSLLAALDERKIAREVGIPHDNARVQFHIARNTVQTFREFEEIVADYVTHDFACCAGGAVLPRRKALGEAKELIENQYRRRGGTLVTAFNEATEGTHMGLRGILDMLCEAIKQKDMEHYVRGCFDSLVAPNAWEEKVELIRQFVQACGEQLGSSIHADEPERYAADYTELVRSYSESLQRTASDWRRL